MRRAITAFRHTRIAPAIAVTILLLLAAPALGAPVKALVGGRLIDGYGGPPLDDSVVLIEGDRIKAVGRVGEVRIPDGAEVISTEGMSVLPGLWDMHVHLRIVGHGDYAHWDKTYPPLLRSTVPAMDAIRAATFWPAVAMKVDQETGTVTAGKRADVIAVRGDVLRHVDLLQDVDVVIKGGVRYK